MGDAGGGRMTDTREQTAERLLRSSLRTWYDPVVEIDWEAPLDPDAFWLPAQRSSLYGTSLWDGLDQRQRVELTKHEVASGASAATNARLAITNAASDANPASTKVIAGAPPSAAIWIAGRNSIWL